MRWLVFSLFLLPFAAFGQSCPAECPAPDTAKLWEDNEAIFVGRVLGGAPGNAPIPGYEYGAAFEILRGWKGASDGGVISLRAKHHPRLCTRLFEAGGEYLVFAKKNSKGDYYTDITPCSPNRPVAAAAEWINGFDLMQARYR